MVVSSRSLLRSSSSRRLPDTVQKLVAPQEKLSPADGRRTVEHGLVRFNDIVGQNLELGLSRQDISPSFPADVVELSIGNDR